MVTADLLIQKKLFSTKSNCSFVHDCLTGVQKHKKIANGKYKFN